MGGAELAACDRLHPILYTLITNGYATLKELRDDYDMDEVLDMYDACMTSLSNKARIIEEGRRK